MSIVAGIARFIKRRWWEFTHSFTGWMGVMLAGILGIILGVGIFTAQYAGVTGYLGDNPATCASCHAMEEQYQAWQKGSHHNVATCNDCHAPHDNIVAKYLNKAENGLAHSVKFTLQNYPENIQIREHNRAVTEAACVYCHGDFVEQTLNSAQHSGETVSCIRCHDGVGHMR